MGFNSGFKGLIIPLDFPRISYLRGTLSILIRFLKLCTTFGFHRIFSIALQHCVSIRTTRSVRCLHGIGYIAVFSHFLGYRRQFVLIRQLKLGYNFMLVPLAAPLPVCRYYFTYLNNLFIYSISVPTFLFGPFFLKYSEDGGSKLLRILLNCIPVYATSYPWQIEYSTPLRETQISHINMTVVVEESSAVHFPKRYTR